MENNRPILKPLTVGVMIKNLRKEIGFTQKEVSIESGIDMSIISKLENDIHFPTKTIVKVVLEVLCPEQTNVSKKREWVLEKLKTYEVLKQQKLRERGQRFITDKIRNVKGNGGN